MAKRKKQISFHKEFKLQGESFDSVEEIISFSENSSLDISLFLKEWFNINSFVEVRTSGSTGVPKTIKLQKKHMIHSALATGEYFELFEKTTALLCMSPNFIAGKMMLVRALTLGWNLDVVEPTSTPIKNSKKQYDFCAMVPIQLHNSLAEINNVKKLIVGGGVASNELLKEIQQVKTEIFATYGMTETISHIAVKQLNNFTTACINESNDVVPCHSELLEKAVISNSVEKSHYTILPNIKISIDNRNCLVIDASKIASDKIVTNDLVELISEHEFNWIGRFDTIVNSGGIKLVPEQIEEKLSTIIDKRFFVTGMPDAVLGEKLVLIIEVSIEKRSSFDLQNKYLQKIKELNILTKYELPKAVYFADKFIETSTNKVNRTTTLKEIKRIC